MKYFITFLFLLITPLIILSQNIVLKPILEQPEIITGPRTDIIIPVYIENLSNDEIIFSPKIIIPNDWKLLIPINEISLQAASNDMIFLSIFVPKGTIAGDYTVSIEDAVIPVNIERMERKLLSFLSNKFDTAFFNISFIICMKNL